MEPCSSSGSLAAGTTSVLGRTGLIFGITLNPGSAVSTVTVYDHPSAASGTVLAVLTAPANDASVCLTHLSPIAAQKGITAVVVGTGATALVHFTQSN